MLAPTPVWNVHWGFLFYYTQIVYRVCQKERHGWKFREICIRSENWKIRAHYFSKIYQMTPNTTLHSYPFGVRRGKLKWKSPIFITDLKEYQPKSLHFWDTVYELFLKSHAFSLLQWRQLCLSTCSLRKNVHSSVKQMFEEDIVFFWKKNEDLYL